MGGYHGTQAHMNTQIMGPIRTRVGAHMDNRGQHEREGVRETGYGMNQEACERANEVRARMGEQSTNKSRCKHEQQGPV